MPSFSIRRCFKEKLRSPKHSTSHKRPPATGPLRSSEAPKLQPSSFLTFSCPSTLFSHLLTLHMLLSFAWKVFPSPIKPNKHLWSRTLLNSSIISILYFGMCPKAFLPFCSYAHLYMVFIVSFYSFSPICPFVVVELHITSTYYIAQHTSVFKKHLPSGPLHTTGPILSFFHVCACKTEYHELPLQMAMNYGAVRGKLTCSLWGKNILVSYW